MNEPTTTERIFQWTFALASLAGLVWLWLNLGMEDTILAKVIIVGILWAFWIGVVGVAIALLALLLGMVGVVVKPFRR